MNSEISEESYASDESSENSLEELKEIEARLYSVIHYNNLSEIDPSDLPDGFQIEIDDSNVVTVNLCDEYSLYNPISDNICFYQSETSECSDLSDTNENYTTVYNNSVMSECNQFQTQESTTKSGTTDSSDLINNEKENNDDDDDDDVLIVGTVSGSDSHQHKNKSNANKIKGTEHGAFGKDNLNRSVVCDNSEVCNPVQHSDVTDSNNIITNTSSVKGNKIEEIVISSDDNISSENIIVTPERTRVRKRKRRRMEKNCPKKWTASMMKYYSKISRKKLNFDSSKLIHEMRKSASDQSWFLNEKDRSGKISKRASKRCPRCRQFDHELKHCPEPRKPICCYVCGETGHFEHKCPHKKCFTCGRSNPIYVQMCAGCMNDSQKGNIFCKICSSYQHKANTCPEVWRSFISTTKIGSIVVPLNGINTRKVCCNCAGEGHTEYDCCEIYNSNYPRSNPTFSSYFAITEMMASNKENLKIDIRLKPEEGHVLISESGYNFLQNLSNTIKARLELEEELLTVHGSRTQCEDVFDSVSSFIETRLSTSVTYHKHKKKPPSKTRRTM